MMSSTRRTGKLTIATVADVDCCQMESLHSSCDNLTPAREEHPASWRHVQRDGMVNKRNELHASVPAARNMLGIFSYGMPLLRFRCSIVDLSSICVLL